MRKWIVAIVVLVVLAGGYKLMSRPRANVPAATPAEIACRPVLVKWDAKVAQMVSEDLDAEGVDAKEGMKSLDLMTKDVRAYQRQEALREYQKKVRHINREAEYDELRAAEWAEWKGCLSNQGVDLASVKAESMHSRGIRLGVIKPPSRDRPTRHKQHLVN